MFEVFARYDLVDEGEARPTYTAIARGVESDPATVTNHLAAMRRQFRDDRARAAARADLERRGVGSRSGARPSTRDRAAPDARSGQAMISDRAIDRLREAAAWPELDARYEITGVAGYGGMGTVYVARDHVLDRDVAVKVLDVADQKGSRAARLQREAHILARLDHPGIVPGSRCRHARRRPRVLRDEARQGPAARRSGPRSRCRSPTG